MEMVRDGNTEGAEVLMKGLSSATSVYSGLGGAILRGTSASLTCRAAIACISASLIVGRASGFPSADIWSGSFKCKVVDEAVEL